MSPHYKMLWLLRIIRGGHDPYQPWKLYSASADVPDVACKESLSPLHTCTTLISSEAVRNCYLLCAVNRLTSRLAKVQGCLASPSSHNNFIWDSLGSFTSQQPHSIGWSEQTC